MRSEVAVARRARHLLEATKVWNAVGAWGEPFPIGTLGASLGETGQVYPPQGAKAGARLGPSRNGASSSPRGSQPWTTLGQPRGASKALASEDQKLLSTMPRFWLAIKTGKIAISIVGLLVT